MKTSRSFIKNSSKTIDFGDYDVEIKFVTDGGRIDTDKEYKTKIYRPAMDKLLVVVYDDISGLVAFEKNVLKL